MHFIYVFLVVLSTFLKNQNIEYWGMCLQDTKLQSFIYVFMYLSTKVYKPFFSKTPVQWNDNKICIVRIFTEKIIHAVCFFSIYLRVLLWKFRFFFSREKTKLWPLTITFIKSTSSSITIVTSHHYWYVLLLVDYLCSYQYFPRSVDATLGHYQKQ